MRIHISKITETSIQKTKHSTLEKKTCKLKTDR